MALWVVRAGKYGEQEEFAMTRNYAVIDWPELGDIARFQDEKELRVGVANAYPDKEKSWPQFVGETWAFARKIQVGDLLVLPLKKLDGNLVRGVRANGVIAVGEIVGGYLHVADGDSGTEHRRKVRWINRRIPRVGLPVQLSQSLENTWLTVFQPRFDEKRLREIAERA